MRQTFKFVLSWIFITFILEIFVIFWLYRYKIATFGTNDDALISNIFNGYFGAQYQNNLIFVQPIIAIILKIFQKTLENINLYSHFLLLTVILSYSSIFAHIVQAKNKWTKYLTFILFSLFTLTFITWFSINPTYTGASLFAVGASGFHFLSSIKENNKFFQIFLSLMGSVFLTLGFLIRKESLFVFAVLFIPIFTYLFVKNFDKKNIKYYLPSIGLIFLFLTINSLINSKIYESEEWKQYENLNNSRHQIQLRAPEKELENKLGLVNWDYETYQLFLRMALVDQRKMNQENMSTILQVTNNVVGPSSIFQIKDFSFVNQIKVSFQPWTWILKLLAFSIFLIILSLLFDRKKLIEYLIQLIIYLVPILFLLTVLSSGYQLPERITLNLLAASIPIILFLFMNSQQNFSKLKLPWVVFLTIIMAIGSWDYYKRFAVETQARTNFYASRISYADQQKSFISKLPENIVLMGSSSVFKSDWQFPYSKYEPFDSDKKVAYLGWHNLSPMWINFLDNLGIKGNNFPDSYFESSLVYVESPDNFEFLKKYLQNLNYRFEVVDLGQFGPSDYNMYQLELN